MIAVNAMRAFKEAGVTLGSGGPTYRNAHAASRSGSVTYTSTAINDTIEPPQTRSGVRRRAGRGGQQARIPQDVHHLPSHRTQERQRRDALRVDGEIDRCVDQLSR